VSLDANNGTIIFTPTPGYAGPASFTYEITDAAGATASAGVRLTVSALNPHANPDSGFTASMDTALSLAAAALLANDTDPNGLAFSVTGVSDPTNGTVSFDANTGTIIFTPTPGYAGPASFTYEITDTAGATASASVRLTVSALNPHANPDSGFTASMNTALSIAVAALLANDTDPNGLAFSVTGVSDPTNGTVSFDANTGTIIFTPTPGYAGPASFTYEITDTAGATAAGSVSLSINPPIMSLWSTSATPAVASQNDGTGPLELGVKFTTSIAGTITGLRYYKSANDTGAHEGSLWTGSGTLLADAIFTDETASGWQTVTFSTPITIAAGTLYIAAYHSNGYYAYSPNYFATAYTNGPLTALATGATGNGVYLYSNSSVFPTDTNYHGTNYWVDVLFQADQIVPPVSTFVAIEGSPLMIEASTLINGTDPNGSPLRVKDVGISTNGTVAFNASTNTITFTPTAGYTGPAGFTYTITDTAGGTVSANVALTVAPSAALTTSTLFSPSTIPNNFQTDDSLKAWELGVKFSSAISGTITGMQFYKGPEDIGVHTAELWNSGGALLATAAFTDETASGWQSVTFADAVAISAGQTYIASYHTTSGCYPADAGYFSTTHTSGPLTAPSGASGGGNGVYTQCDVSSFPTTPSDQSFNYWVDVTFKAAIG
jgi:hypothetical protein